MSSNNFFQYLRVLKASLRASRHIKKTSKKLKKWLRKNEKNQDENLHNEDKRWIYTVKRLRKFVGSYMGVKIIVEGAENLPRSAFWMTPNHSSNFDGIYLMAALGDKSKFAAIARDDLKNNKKVGGILQSTNAFFIERDNLRQSIAVLNNAAIYSKQSSVGIIIFPEGRRSFSTKLLPFKAGALKFPQKYFLPIVPVSIFGTMDAKRWWIPKRKYIYINVHKPLKPVIHSRLDSNTLATKIQKIIEDDLIKKYNALSVKDKQLFEKLKTKNETKYKRKYGAENDDLSLFTN